MKISIFFSETKESRRCVNILLRKYYFVSPEKADIFVILGGDGMMLKILHIYMNTKKFIYGMNCGSIGFLMNKYQEENLFYRLKNAFLLKFHPLFMHVKNYIGNYYEGLAINEISLLRKIGQASKICIVINNKKKLNELVCDGLLVSTPVGSTSYNFSVYGPILSLESDLLVLTFISSSYPYFWKSILLFKDAFIFFHVFEGLKRPVLAVSDFFEVNNIISVLIVQDLRSEINILFDSESL